MDLFRTCEQNTVPCMNCKAGIMRPKTRISSSRIILECCNCKNRDDLELRKDDKGNYQVVLRK